MKIDASTLVKRFGEKTAVDIETYHVDNGEIVGLVGNNGAGKTTFFRLMLDLLKADNGEVAFTLTRGEAEQREEVRILPAQSEDWKVHTGSYIDEGFLIDFLTPEEYFAFIGKLNGMDKARIEARMEDFAELMAGEILGQKKLIRDFSAGNKQKVGIIAALFNKPDLLILDEPFNFLDPSSQHVLKRVLTDYNAETGATIIISSHNLAHTIDISSRITLLEHGKIVKDLNNEQHAAEQELIDYFGE